MKFTAFIEVRDNINAYFVDNAPLKANFKGFRVVAIDGTKLNLPSQDVLKERFGIFKNKFKVDSVGAIASIAFDVGNKIIVDAQIDNLKKSEQGFVIEHLKKLNSDTDILVFDRGYPCYWLISLLQSKNFKFCFRISKAWKKAFLALENKTDIDWKLFIQTNTKGLDNFQKDALVKEISGIRLVSITLKSGEKEVLLTNLIDRAVFTKEVLTQIAALPYITFTFSIKYINF